MNYLKEEVNLIVADSFSELTYKHKRYFLAAVKGGEENKKYADSLIKSCGAGVYNKLREQFSNEAYRAKVIAEINKKGVECVTYKSADYPEGLKNIPVPPLVLYVRGNRELLKEKAFCIVGSRKSTAQALEVCRKFSAELSNHFVIATGVADGADNAAAVGALPSGRIICVLPCGHGFGSDTLRKVEKNGLSISEFPPEMRAQQFMFTLRNRILAGLCCGVLVISAGIKGGALSTAGYAVEYGKEVFALPYGVGVASGAGCNKLIKSGANLCDCEEDIYFAMGIKCAEGSAFEGDDLDEDERAVLAALKQDGEMHAEKLAERVGKPMYELSAICSSLEIKGLLVRTGGNKYAAL